MDLERLTKTQIILLTLLVSFVTSIATGIATVALMEKAPTDVTRVISRIVEKPIETITQGTGETIIQERTVIVSEGELVAEAVKKVSPSVVRLYALSGRDERTFMGLGVITSAAGLVIADRRIVDTRDEYVAILSNGTSVVAVPSGESGEQGLFRLDRGTTNAIFIPITFTNFDALTLGQTVVAISGDETIRITPGVIAELIPAPDDDSASRLRATIDPSGIVLGSPLITLSGALIGMPEGAESQVFLSLRATAVQ